MLSSCDGVKMYILSSIVWHSFIATLIINFIKNEKHAWYFSIASSFLSVFLACVAYSMYDETAGGLQFVESVDWISFLNAKYFLAVDGISIALILLTSLTTMIICLISRSLIKTNYKQYISVFLMMQTMINGVFCAQDTLLFFLFWEGSLIPMYLCIGIWGSQQRSLAARKFFIYTFLGSTLLLISVLFLGLKAGSFSFSELIALNLDLKTQCFLFIAFLLAFAIKVPMFPVHTWLPDAHTEAPTGGSVLLAALLLKVGGYGFVRFSLPITPDASAFFAMPMIILSLIAIVYVGLIALVQQDMKRLIAYSSVAHMGFVTLGMFGIYLIPGQLSPLAFNGAMIQMISHAFASGAMFLAFGMIYERLHTRQISELGGIASKVPYLSAFFLIFCMANIGVPGTSGFVGELLVIASFLKTNLWISFAAGLTLIISASYTLWMYRNVFMGPVAIEGDVKDVNIFESTVLAVLVACIFLFGVYPKPMGDLLDRSGQQVISQALKFKVGEKA